LGEGPKRKEAMGLENFLDPPPSAREVGAFSLY